MTRPSGRVLLVPAGLAAALAAFLLVPFIRQDRTLTLTFLGAAAAIVLWAAVLHRSAMERGRALTIEVVVRKPHFVQMCAQGAVLLYWGWYVRSVYAFAPFILAQVVFAYAVESLVSFSRYGNYRLGVGPVPVIFSINLFLWFKLEWFYWQLAMVALVFVGKEFIRWTREGRSVHIFNPSSFALAVASAALILTQATDHTLGLEIAATQNNPPHIYAIMFLAAVPGQLLFGVATMTMSAAVTVVAFGLAYFGITGTYFFHDAFIPIAVFLGMNLLFTDPSTSPRSEMGRVLFGILYGVGIIVSVVMLDAIGAPTFYDKLLPVPILNLMVRRIDRLMATGALRAPVSWTFGRALSAAQRRVAVVGVWTVAFLAFSVTDVLGDDHPGQYLPFWRQACESGSGRACDYLAVMEENYCDRGSGWACNELGILVATHTNNLRGALGEFQRSCALSFEPGCENTRRIPAGTRPLARARPPVRELPIVLRGSKGPVLARDSVELYALACERGWPGTCE